MTVRCPHGTAHVPQGTPEYQGDSQRWLRQVAGEGRNWPDLNALLDKDGVAVNAHYPVPLRHGFVDPVTDPRTKLHADTPLHHMTRAEWGRLLTRDPEPYTIHSMAAQLELAASLSLHVEVELKCRFPLAALKALHDAAPDPRTVTVKVGLWQPGQPWEWLELAHRYFTTLALTHGPRGAEGDPHRFARIPRRYQFAVDEFRGLEPVWV